MLHGPFASKVGLIPGFDVLIDQNEFTTRTLIGLLNFSDWSRKWAIFASQGIVNIGDATNSAFASKE